MQAWQRRTIDQLTPIITEYAQALVKVKIRPDETGWKPWFEPKLVLVRKDHQEGDDKATCQFIVHDTGSWDWMREPQWHDDYEPVPVDVESVRTNLTCTLSGAMKSALPD